MFDQIFLEFLKSHQNKFIKKMIEEEENNSMITRKIVLIGGPSVGKTSIINKFIGMSTPMDTNPTVQLAFSTKVVELEGYSIKLQICDTAGQERFQSVAPNFYRSSDAAIVVFDVTERNSFVKVKDWLDELNAVMPESFIVLVAGNKHDLDEKRAVTYDEAIDFAQSNDVTYMEVSAKTGTGIENLFLHVSEKFIEALQKPGSFVEEPVQLNESSEVPPEEKKRQCC
ncbi:Ras-related protein Rab-17 [Tritrichomonas foetus]|uniref:Ras-related protein Rab-17 n=1 Tax=Tritrichomonas foetus TaxID=1144522 RepID=A0A1J4KC60_9EUKA|nr:Ras-related protein Rab-17 [Tritrichomonas foetus]|eukprot:OHT07246.1 Ras-related protein Rab-17 [Tritrichomonas foetus]